MKRGDILRRERTYEKGEIILSGCSDETMANNWMQHEFFKHYQTDTAPAYNLAPAEDNPSKLSIVAGTAFITKEDARVIWVIDQEAAICFISDQTAHLIINIEDPSWKVLYEAVPSYQSQVASLSDEELKAAIDAARYARASAQPEKTSKRVQQVHEEIDPLEAKLATLSPEDRQKIMTKLGLI